jgi:hypothetical protein
MDRVLYVNHRIGKYGKQCRKRYTVGRLLAKEYSIDEIVAVYGSQGFNVTVDKIEMTACFITLVSK